MPLGRSIFRSLRWARHRCCTPASLGQRTGIVTINPRYISWHHHQIRKYGLEHRITGVHAMTFEPGEILKAYESNESRASRWNENLPIRPNRWWPRASMY